MSRQWNPHTRIECGLGPVQSQVIPKPISLLWPQAQGHRHGKRFDATKRLNTPTPTHRVSGFYPLIPFLEVQSYPKIENAPQSCPGKLNSLNVSEAGYSWRWKVDTIRWPKSVSRISFLQSGFSFFIIASSQKPQERRLPWWPGLNWRAGNGQNDSWWLNRRRMSDLD